MPEDNSSLVDTGEWRMPNQQPPTQPSPTGEQVDPEASYRDDLNEFTARLADVWSGIIGHKLTQKQVILMLQAHGLTVSEMYDHGPDSTQRALNGLVLSKKASAR